MNGGRALTVTAGTGSVTFSGAVGGTTALSSLAVTGSGGIRLAANVATTGAIDFNSAVTLTGSGGLTVSSGTGAGNISFDSTVNGGRALTVTAGTGSVTFSGAVGGTTALTGFSVSGNSVSLRSVRVSGTGTIAVTGSGGITLNGTYTTANRNIDFNSAVTLAGAVTVNSGSGIGNVSFDSTVNGGHALTVTAGTGSVTFSGAVGGTTALSSLAVTGSGGIRLAANVATTGAIDFNSAVTLTGSGGLTVSSGTGAGNISFDSTVNGGRALTVTAGTGSVTFSGAVGGTTALTGFSVSGNSVSLRSVRVSGTGTIAVTGSGGITLNGTYTTANRNIDFNSAVTLAGAVTVNSGSGIGNVSFDSTVNGGHALTVTAGTGSVTFSGAVGGTTALSSLAVTGSGGIRLAANVATTGAIDFNSAVTLTGSGGLTVSSGTGAGNISFDSTVNGGRALTVTAGTGSVTFSGAVGGTTALSSLAVTGSGGIRLAANVATTGAIDFNSAVTLTGSGGLTVSSGTGAGNISFDSTVNGGRALTVTAGTGSVTFSGAVGGTTALSSLAVTGSGGIRLAANVATTGAIDFNSAVTLTGSGGLTVSSGTGAGNISFDSTVNGGRALTVTAGTGSVTFSGAVGGGTRLTNLTVSGGQVDLNTVATTGAISVTGSNIDLNAGSYSSQGGNITFTGAVDLHTNVTVGSGTGGGNITFTSSVNAVSEGAQSLTLDAGSGDVELRGAVGGTIKLNNLTITGDDIRLGAVTLAGTLTLNAGGTITLKGDITVDDTAISFGRPVVLAANIRIDTDDDNDEVDGSITFSSTVNGGFALTLDADTAAVTMSGAVGGSTRLASLTVTGGQIDLNTVATTGAISVTGTNIDLNGATYYSQGGNITFTGPVDLHTSVTVDSDSDNVGADGSITFTSTVNAVTAGAQSLTLDADRGAVTVSGAIGGTTKLSSLTVTGGAVSLKDVKATGAIRVTGRTSITLAGAYESDAGGITFTGAVTLAGAVSVDSDKDGVGADGSITFTSTVNGGHALTLDADGGNVELRGAVGSSTRLASLTVNGGQIDLNSVAASGAITVTGTNIDLNGATYNSQGGNIAFTGPVDLDHSSAVSVSSGSGGGNISFSSTVNGAQALTVTAGTGSVTFSGAVGGSTRLASLTVSGGQIDLSTVATTGAISVTGTNIDLNGATYNSQDGNIRFDGPVDLHANVTVDSDQDNDNADGSITFTSTVNAVTAGMQSLTLDAGSGAVTVSGAIGGTIKLSSLTVNGGAVSLRDVKTAGVITVTGSTGITLAGAYESDDGNIRFDGAVTLAGAVSVDSDKDGLGTDGNITFTSTVNGGHALTIDADRGTVTLSGAIGGSIRLTSLTVDGGQIDVNTVATTGAIDISGTNIDLNGTSYASQDGNIRFDGPVDLHANVRVDSNSDNVGAYGSITFTSTVDGAKTLTLDADRGAVDMQAAVGGTVKLTSLTVNGGQIDLNTVATNGAISVTGTNIDLNGTSYASQGGNIRFDGPVDLHANVTVDSDEDDDGTDGSITFTSTVNAVAEGAQSLTLDADGGDVTVSGEIGGSIKLASLTVNGGSVSLNGAKATGAITVTGPTLITLSGPYESNDGNIDFNGPVTLAGHVSVDSDKDGVGTDGNITFTSTVNAANSGTQSLTIDADRGSVELRGAVGGATLLSSLTVVGGQVDVNTVATTGAINIRGTNIDLNGGTYNSQGGPITFDGPVDLHTSVTVDSDSDNVGADGSIRFTSTVDAVAEGMQSLTLDADRGAVTLEAAVGGTVKLSSLTVTGGAVSLKDVKVTGPITVTGHSSITLDGNYESDDGSIRILGAVTLAGAVSVNSDQDDDTTDGSITFSRTVNGTYALTLDADSGSITVGDAMGGTTKLASLTATAALVYLKDVKATGPIMVTGSTGITLDGDYESDGDNIDFDGAVTLADHVSVDSDKDGVGTDGNITFTSTVDGGYSLTIDADGGDVELRGAVGGTTPLSGLTVVGGQVDLNTAATTGAINIRGTNIDLNGATYLSQDGPITFSGPVDLHTSVTVDSDSNDDGTSGNITFTSTVNAANAGMQSLTIDADTGNVELRGAVGGTSRLSSLTVDGGQIDLASVATTGAIDIDGANIDLNGSTYGSNDGPITFTGPVDLQTGVTVDSDQNDDGTDGFITFTSTVNGPNALTIDADSGNVELRGAVGGSSKLTSLTVDGGQIDLVSVATTGAIDIDGTNIDLNGSTYGSDDGNVDFRAAVDLYTNVTVDSDNDNDGTAGNITFHSTVNAATAGNQSLTLDAGVGLVTLSGSAGGSSKLASLTVDGGQIDLASVATTGLIDIDGTNIDLNGSTYGSDDGNVDFRAAVDLHTSVTVDSDNDNDGTAGNITFHSTVDAANEGTQSLTLDAGSGSVALLGAVGGTTRLSSLTVSGGQIDLNTVATTGAIDITGTNIDLNGSTYESDDGDIRFAGPVDLHTDVSVDSDKDDDTADGNITFTSTIDAATRGAQSLTLDADTGTITIEGAIGGTTALRDLTTNGGMVELKGGFTLTGDFEVPGAITLGEGAYNSANANYGGPVTLSGNVTMTSSGNAGDGITFGSTITGTYSLVLNAGDGTVTISGEAGTEDSPLASLTVNAGSISLNSVRTTGAITLTGTTIDLDGTDYRSDDGDITFNGPTNLNSDTNDDGTADPITFASDDGNITFNGQTNLNTDVTMDSDANDDGTTGSITFADNVNGAGQSLTIVRAHDVTVKATMTVASFTQLEGTGTTDFGSNSLHAETFVDVSTGNIFGTIFAEDATLRASNLIRVNVEVGSLTIEAKDAYVTGTVDELDGQAAADSIIINNRGPGVYKANGFTILGTGPGTRTYAELSALPFSVTMDAARYSSTPASAVYGSRIPVLRASVTDATVGPYTINAHEMPFPLFTQQPSADCTEDELQCVGLDMH